MILRLLVLLMIAASLVVIEGACATTTTTVVKPKKKAKKKKKPQASAPVVAELPEDEADSDGDSDSDGTEGPGELTAVVVAEGKASFYHDSLAGRLTANGEKYNPQAPTCAHKTLPFGSIVVVEDLDTGKRVRCRINDRGPYIEGRIIDLSRRLAKELGMIERGVANVRIRVTKPKSS